VRIAVEVLKTGFVTSVTLPMVLLCGRALLHPIVVPSFEK
jgi:hypothetical protein